jgi:hypothetical protein
VAIQTLLGQKIYQEKNLLNPGLNQYQINTSAWPNGIYFLMVTDESGVLHQRKIEIIHR